MLEHAILSCILKFIGYSKSQEKDIYLYKHSFPRSEFKTMEPSKPQKTTDGCKIFKEHSYKRGYFFITVTREELSQRTKYPQIPSKSKVKALHIKSNKLLSHSFEENIGGAGAQNSTLPMADRTLQGMRKPQDTKDE